MPVPSLLGLVVEKVEDLVYLFFCYSYSLFQKAVARSALARGNHGFQPMAPTQIRQECHRHELYLYHICKNTAHHTTMHLTYGFYNFICIVNGLNSIVTRLIGATLFFLWLTIDWIIITLLTALMPFLSLSLLQLF